MKKKIIISTKRTPHEQAKADMAFLYEAMFDLNKNGWVEGGKAHTMLGDWLNELKDKSGFNGTDKQLHDFAEEYTGMDIV